MQFLVARSAELLLNEIENGTHPANVFDMIIVFVFKNTNGHDIVAYGLGDKIVFFFFFFFFTRTKRRVVIVQ